MRIVRPALLLSVCWACLQPSSTIPEQASVQRDLEYGSYESDGARHPLLLDLYLPASRDRGRSTTVVYLHGGGWFEGNKSACPGETLARHGYAVACVGYRLARADGCPAELTFPVQVEDVRTAVRWLREHADDHHLDPGRFATLGDSSGGHLALLAGLWNDEAGANPRWPSSEPQAIASWYGPVDVTRGPEIVFEENPCDVGWDHLSRKYGGEATPYFYWTFAWATFLGGSLTDPLILGRAHAATPLGHIDARDPPVLLVHGQDDGMVPISQSELAVAALNEAGVDVTFVGLSGVGHSYDSASQQVAPEFLEPTLRFFERHLGGG